MIENYLLEYLVAFVQTGTIAKAAQQLGVTQPTISRGLKNLEKLLGVHLFIHQPQKLSLTPTGEYAYHRAHTLLKQQMTFRQAVQQFDQHSHSPKIGSTIPGPLWLIATDENKHFDQQVEIGQRLLSPASIQSLLVNHHYSLILSGRDLHNQIISSQPVGTESLAIKVTRLNRLYSRATVHFADLNGHEFIAFKELGEWRQLIEKRIPDALFLYQSRRTALHELIRSSNFPIFKTNITDYLDAKSSRTDPKRKLIPIDDPAASMTIYASFLQSNRQSVAPIVKGIKDLLVRVPPFDLNA